VTTTASPRAEASSEGSADVFVSYSRTDQAFVRELVARLSARGKEIWVDWESIPPTAEWLAEIHEAIETTDAFLFVLSPASASSEMCLEELAHAERLGKRIVPVEIDTVDPSSLPSALADRQWIFFDEEATALDRSVDTLVLTLDTDLEWVKQHTQWLGKAREWERHGRDRSFLLRGSELRAAETWLTTPGAADKEPPATPLQNEYVLASRRAASRRQRSVLAAVTVALAVTAVLAAVAYVQRDRANAQRRVAVSELAANVSGQRLESSLDTALLLAAAAYDIEETAAARDALLTGIRRTADVGRLLRIEPPPPLRPPAFSGDGRLLATVNGPVIEIVDLSSGEQKAEIPVQEPDAFVLDEPGSVLAVAADGQVAIWSLPPAGEAPAEPRTHDVPRAAALAFARDGSRLAIGTNDGAVLLLEPDEGRLTPVAELDAESPILSLAFDRTGATLAAGSYLGVHLARVERPRSLGARLEDEVARAVAFTGRNELSVVTGDKELVVVNTQSDERVCERPGSYEALHVDRAGRLALGSRSGALLLRARPCDKGGRALTGHGSAIAAIGSSPARQELVSADASGLVVVWELASSSLVGRTRSGLADVTDVAFGLRSGELVVAAEAGLVRVSEAGDVRRFVTDARDVRSLASAEGALVAAGRPAVLWTGPSYDQADWLGDQSALHAALSSDGGLLALGSRPGVVDAWSVETLEHRRLNTGIKALTTALAADESDRVAAGDTTGRIVLWEVGSEVTQTVVRPRGERETSVDALAFGPGGRLLAAATDDALEVHDLRAGTSRTVQTGNPIQDVTFVSDGSQVVTGHTDGSIRVWDLSSSRGLGQPLYPGGGAILGLDLSASGTTLAAVSGDGTVYRLTEPAWEPTAAVERVCAITRGSLRPEEWSSVATGFPLPRPCER
jgi:WD40 repeat protein